MSSSLCQAAVQCFNWQDCVIGSRYFVSQRETTCLRRLVMRLLEIAGYREVICVPREAHHAVRPMTQTIHSWWRRWP